MPGGAGTPGGYDGGSGSSSGGGGGDGGAAQRAAAQRVQAQLDADRLNASRAATAAAKEAEARANAREKAIQTAALTTKTPTRSPHGDTPTQIQEQLALDKYYKDEKDYGFEDAKARAPTTFKPKTKPITIHGKDGSYTKDQPVKYSPTYYQDRSKIGGETWGERAEKSARPGSGIMGMIGKVAPFVLPALLPAKLGQLYSGYNQLTAASRYAKQFGLTENDIMSSLTGNLKSNIGSNIKRPTFRDERTTLGKQDLENWERKQDWSGIKTAVGGGDGQGQAQVPKDVVTESIQKFSPEQADIMKQRHSQLQGVLDSGTYQGRQLTAEEIQMLQQKSLEIQKLMEQYLVDPKELGLARGGIADLYRYGGFI